MSIKSYDFFSFVSLRATSTVPASKSLLPMAIRTGTPLRSHSANLKPGLCVSLVSNFTLMPFARRFLMIGSIRSLMASSCSIPLYIGTITTCIGARLGGSTSPSSSECVITSAPISRVLTPQLVAHTCSSFPSLLANFTSNALAKF